MSRSSRQAKILELVSLKDIETQEELAEALRSEGYNVTQATVSRDIKELALFKTQTSAGGYKYATRQLMQSVLSGKMLGVLRQTVLSVVTAENLVVVTTLADSAATVRSALEQVTLQGVLGMLADRNTLLIVCATHAEALVVAQSVLKLTD